ncbi:phenylalanine--tRNA ligase subunit beta [Bacteroidota bacterium]
MKISYNWLKEYIDLDIEPAELSRILTDTGLEVEGMEEFQSVKGGLEGVVIGKVLTCSKHPNADKLSVTTVDIGEAEPVQIVCGAPNVAAGQTVPVARVGTTLYPAGSEEGFTIKKATIRGEASSGMICAEDELGMGTDHEGIMILDDSAAIGSKASEYFRVENDVVFEIGLTPNRIDGASHIGVARDIAAYLRHRGSSSAVKKPAVDRFEKGKVKLSIDVEVRNFEACPRYSGVTLTNLNVSESPEWLKNRLEAIGQVPINNVVDITNFVLHETGQPLHAFDAKKIKGNRVIVQTLKEGTVFTALDEKERKLTANDLMICNAENGMCIGGIFGGIESGVNENTTSIFLESACFDPVYIRKSAKHHQLSTDASFRFERGTDPNGTIYALKRAAIMMTEIAGGTIASDITDIYPDPVKDFEVEISFEGVTRLIGKIIEPGVIRGILESLDIQVASESKDGMLLHVPPYRVDVKREADIVEELLRIYGYNNVEFDEHVNSTLSYVDKPDKEKVINTVSDMLTALGFFEIKSNSLTKETYYTKDDKSIVRIQNALSQDLSRMRSNLLFGGLEAILYNINRKRSDLKLYEFGNCYFYNPEIKKDHPQQKYSEALHMGIFLTGKQEEENWISKAEQTSFYQLKTNVQMLLDKLGISTGSYSVRELSNGSYEQALEYVSEKGMVVTFGKVSTRLLRNFDISQDVYAAEFNFNNVLAIHKKAVVKFSPLPRFPEVRRDLSLLLDKSVTFEKLHALAFQTERKLLRHVDLFDVYEGDKIEEGKKSYALSFILLDEYKTLTDKQIDKTMNSIAQVLEKETGAVVRGA